MAKSAEEGLREQYRNATNLNARVQLHERFSTNKYGWHRWTFEQLQLPPRARILELGCGSGDLWVKNTSRVPGGWEITLSDFSPGMLRDAQRNLHDAARLFQYMIFDAQSIPFVDSYFDAVVANHMLYHVPDRPRALSEIRRVLKPDGRFYASTIGERHLRELHELMGRFVSDPSSIWGNSLTWAFTLENGAEQIRQWFPDVELRRYEDELLVTETEPLVAYVLSGLGEKGLADSGLGRMRAAVDEAIAERGAYRITKDSGLFEAW